MSTYRNGEIPDHLLERRGNFLATAGSWAKWDAFVADVFARYGVTLRITDGVGVMKGTGAYRTRPMQRAVKKHYTALGRPWQAATEGTSSHGGEFKGEDALAFDVNNYWAISYEDFCAACRRAGFKPDYFDGKHGRPKEPWHIIDPDPYRRLPSPASDKTEPAPIPEEEDEDMKPTVHVRTGDDLEYMLVHPEFGKDLAVYTGPGKGGKKTEGKVTIFRGFMVTTDQAIGIAWARLYANGAGNEKSRTNRAGYIAIQVEASRVAAAIS